MQKEIFNFFERLKGISHPIVWAIIVFLIGYFISRWLGNLCSKALKRMRLNQLLKGMGLEEAFFRMEIKLDAEKFIGTIVKIFFIILFLMLAFEILELKLFAGFLGKVIAYYSNIFVACLLFIIAVFLSNFANKILIARLEKEKITYSAFLGRWINLAVWIVMILAILYQLKIVPEIILAVLIGFVVAFSLTIGISFGLGGKDLVAKFLKEFEEKFKK